MPSIIEFILTKPKIKPEEIKAKLATGYTQQSIFTPIPELNGRSIYEHIRRYQKLRGLKLEDLISSGAINIEEKNAQQKTLLQLYITSNNLVKVQSLLMHGARIYAEDLELTANEQVQKFFAYRPGQGNPSVFEYCSKRVRPTNYLQNVKAIIFDANDTTDNESSDEESFSDDELTDAETRTKRIRSRRLTTKYNNDNEDEEANKSIRFLAARGTHFSPKYFNSQAISRARQTRKQSHSTFSQSTLFDAGYDANSRVSEANARIKIRHRKNVKFIKDMEEKDDKKEKRIGRYTPPKSRNDVIYPNLLYRFLQVYINSYSTLFNLRSIQKDFDFDSVYNLLISASWSFAKAAMYGSGFRFNWNTRELRRNPHYRRFTGKPKHPNMGYIDVYAFDIKYVKENGYDRQILCKDGHIFLSSFYRHEAEIIFVSMIPVKYHKRRCIISLPNFQKSYDQHKRYFENHGISKIMYNRYKNTLRISPENSLSEVHEKLVNSITERSSERQAERIKNTAHCRLFREDDRKIVAHDHGDSIALQEFNLS